MSIGAWLLTGLAVVFGLFSIACWRTAFKTMALVDQYEQRLRGEHIRLRWRHRTLRQRRR